MKEYVGECPHEDIDRVVRTLQSSRHFLWRFERLHYVLRRQNSCVFQSGQGSWPADDGLELVLWEEMVLLGTLLLGMGTVGFETFIDEGVTGQTSPL